MRYGENETWTFLTVSLPSKRTAQIKIGLGGFQWVMKTKQSSPLISINNKILTNVHTELLKNLWVQRYENKEAATVQITSGSWPQYSKDLESRKKPCPIPIFLSHNHINWKHINWRVIWTSFSLKMQILGLGKEAFAWISWVRLFSS